MNTKPFDLKKALAGEPVVTRNGAPVKIAGYNEFAYSDETILGWVNRCAFRWFKNGENSEHPSDPDLDLFMAPIEKKEWIVRYDGRLMGPFETFEKAIYWYNLHGGTIHEITIEE